MINQIIPMIKAKKPITKLATKIKLTIFSTILRTFREAITETRMNIKNERKPIESSIK